MNRKSNLIHLSQGHLNLLEICPPKFQQVYLDCLGSLPDPQQQESLAWGSRFHLLMQQRELALPIEPLLQTDAELDRSLSALIKAEPNILVNDANIWREAEHCRTLNVSNFLLTAIYDLLVAETDKATILDWKTYRQPPRKHKLARNWQTRLYRYLLVETSEYLPEQVVMTYWFVKSADLPQSYTFAYSSQEHQQTKQDLTCLLDNLERWLEAYNTATIPFPHHPNCQNHCPFFEALGITTNNEPSISIDEIDEVCL